LSNYSPSKELIRRLALEITAAGQQNLVPQDDANNIADALSGRSENFRVQLYVPYQITANIKTDLADLAYIQCAKCGTVYGLDSNPNLLKDSRCIKCGGPLVATPLWVITGQGVPIRRISTTQGIKTAISLKEYTKVRVHATNMKLPTRIFIEDRSRPIATLKFMYGSTPHEPSPIHSSKIFRYQLALMPSESITKPVTITAFAYRKHDCTEVGKTMGPISGISGILYCSDLEVLQATLLYKAGHPRSSSGARISVLDIEPSKLSPTPIIRIPVRYIRTRGIVVKIDRESAKSALKELGYSDDDVWIALHTISHAFLVSLPRITGLEGTDFGEALSEKTDEIAVFDNSLGGLGGIEGVIDISNKVLEPNYEASVRESYKCPLACTRACKACLFTDSCFMLNWRLDRRILEKLGW